VGWLDFFFGPPGKDKFAQLALAELRKQGGKAASHAHASSAASGAASEMRYDRERFLITQGDGGFLNLSNVYQEYCHAPRDRRQAVLQAFVRSCLGTVGYELPEDFADVHPDLLPVIRSRFYLESVALQARTRGNDGINVPQQLIGDHLALSLVYDLPQAMRSIGQDDLDRWGVTFYEAVEAAQQNLQQMGKIAFAQIGEGLFASATGDNYDASRLMLMELVQRFPLRGTPIAMVPNRDMLLLTGEDDEQGLETLAKIAAESLNQPRPISTVALRLEDDGWQSWLPQRGTPAFTPFHELRLRTLGAEYNDQKELLDQSHQASGTDVYVAQFSAVQKQATGRVTSYAVWSEGLETLLPETDDLLFLRPSEQGEGGDIVAGGPWEKVQQIVGDLLQPQGIYPERYLVAEFPSPQQLQQIGMPDE
jgi:hypothetical protein